MELDELIKTVKKIDLLLSTKSVQKLTGSNPSPTKGRGVVFDSIRKYEAGDDVRTINWSVTARFRDTYVNTFNEDRVRRVWLLIDVSGSGLIGTSGRPKIDLEMEIGATIAYNAIRKNDSVGVIFFSDKIERLIMPIKGSSGFWYIAKAMTETKPAAGATRIESALNLLTKLNSASNLIFVISDFLTSGYQPACKLLAQNNDLLAIRVYDKIEHQIPKLGWVKLKDVESGKKSWTNTSSRHFYDRFSRKRAEIDAGYRSFLAENNVKSIDIGTHEDAIEKILLLMS